MRPHAVPAVDTLAGHLQSAAYVEAYSSLDSVEGDIRRLDSLPSEIQRSIRMQVATLPLGLPSTVALLAGHIFEPVTLPARWWFASLAIALANGTAWALLAVREQLSSNRLSHLVTRPLPSVLDPGAA